MALCQQGYGVRGRTGNVEWFPLRDTAGMSEDKE
jgi:hypothetical protein